jgi:hypothetical protein
MRKLPLLVIVSFLLAVPFPASGQPPESGIEILYPVDGISLKHGETSEIPVNIKNTGDLTVANLNVTFEAPEGWHSGWEVINFIYIGLNKTVGMGIRPANDSFGDYDVVLRLVSTISGVDERKTIKAVVSGEPPQPEPQEPGERTVSKEEAEEMINRARGSIQEALDSGVDVTSAANVFSRALESYNRGDYAHAILLADLSYSASEKALGGVVTELETGEQEPRGGEVTVFDYTLIVVLLLLIVALIAVNKFFL